MSEVEVGEAQALQNVIQGLGPIKIVFRGSAEDFEKELGRQWDRARAKWYRTLEWHGSRW